ncbi:hypothetical protein Sjap_018961 [Stephania japonica]|uniref:Hydroxyproline-rich glycoprotein family protein n=1 Tax=Stephania japonica TaxID=461633 RepID=A0AAP0F0Q3_9MAGN
MAINRDPSTTPPPLIGKIGRYTVFITPPSTPKPFPDSESETSVAPTVYSPKKVDRPSIPPVQAPPQQIEKPIQARSSSKSSSAVGFFWSSVEKVQNAHSSLDHYLSEWFGLDQSKYQWALNDYYETQGKGKEEGKPKELASKGLNV